MGDLPLGRFCSKSLFCIHLAYREFVGFLLGLEETHRFIGLLLFLGEGVPLRRVNHFEQSRLRSSCDSPTHDVPWVSAGCEAPMVRYTHSTIAESLSHRNDCPLL